MQQRRGNRDAAVLRIGALRMHWLVAQVGLIAGHVGVNWPRADRGLE